MEKGAGLFIVYGVYHWKTKRVAFRDDYCLVCGEARRAVQVRTFDGGTFLGFRSCQQDFGNAGYARCVGAIRM